MTTPHEFAGLLAAARHVRAGGRGGAAALATLVDARGSTFRRPGARMLVCADGSSVCALAGGCPEADIAARAAEVLRAGMPRLLRYDRRQGYDVLLEMGCGGELEVLIEPLDAALMDAFEAIQGLIATRRTATVTTVFARDGRCLTPQIWRCIDGGAARAIDTLVDKSLRPALVDLPAPGARADVVELSTAGGDYSVLRERLEPPLALLLIGTGAVARSLARLGLQLGWVVKLVDHRADLPEGWPSDLPRLVASPVQAASRLRTDARTAVVVMTHHLERDIDYLKALRDQPTGYLGAIGSRARAAELIAATGLRPPRLCTPAGLDLGAETPEEIALAIAAEIQAVSAGRCGGALIASDAPLHGPAA